MQQQDADFLAQCGLRTQSPDGELAINLREAIARYCRVPRNTICANDQFRRDLDPLCGPLDDGLCVGGAVREAFHKSQLKVPDTISAQIPDPELLPWNADCTVREFVTNVVTVLRQEGILAADGE
jgi:hypothetical protein